MTRRRQGFTLIEVLIVIVILGILAAIALTRFWQVRQHAMTASVRTDLRNLAMRQELYFDVKSKYASALSELDPIQLSPGVVMEITYGDTGGWAARSWHESRAGNVCALFLGSPHTGTTPADGPPGVVTCE